MPESRTQYLLVAEAADVLRVGRRAVYNLVAEGELGHVRLGSGPKARIRIPVSALDEFAHRSESLARAPRTAESVAVEPRAHGGGNPKEEA